MVRRLLTIVILPVALGALAEHADGRSVDEAVRGYLYQSAGLDSASIEVELLSSPFHDPLRDDQTVTIQPLTQGTPSGLYSVLVRVTDDDGTVGQGQVRLRIHRFAQALVAVEQVSRHAELEATQFEVQRIETTSLLDAPITSFDVLPGHRAARHLAKGKPLTTAMLEAVPEVSVGTSLSIVYTHGALTISVPGRAMQDGRIGEHIKVKNLASGRTLAARVVDSRSVAIDP